MQLTLVLSVAAGVLALCAESVLLECPPLFEEIQGSCYQFSPDVSMTWSDARAFCHEMTADLAVIDDCDQLATISRHIDLNGLVPASRGYWIGATDELQEGDFKYIDGTTVPLEMPFWGSIADIPEPSGGEFQNCVGLSSSDRYYFNDIECEAPLAPICQRSLVFDKPTEETTSDDPTTYDPTTYDPTTYESTTDEATTDEVTTDEATTDTFTVTAITTDGYTADKTTTEEYSTPPLACKDGYVGIGRECFLFLPNVTVTWEAARIRCSAEGGAVLAEINDCDVLRSIAQYITANANATPDLGYWIGASDEGTEGVFEWTSGGLAPVRMPFWGSSMDSHEPNGGSLQNCVALYANDRYYFHDFQCDMRMSVLCVWL